MMMKSKLLKCFRLNVLASSCELFVLLSWFVVGITNKAPCLSFISVRGGLVTIEEKKKGKQRNEWSIASSFSSLWAPLVVSMVNCYSPGQPGHRSVGDG